VSTFVAVTVALLIAHATGDFLLQRRRVIDGKRSREWIAYAEHGGVHFGTLLVAWLLFAPLPLIGWGVAGAFAVILLTHLLADWIKETTAPGGGPWTGPTPYLLDQFFHVIVIVLVAAWLSGAGEVLASLASGWRAMRTDVGLLIAGYVLVVFGAGYLNAMVLRDLAPPEPAPEPTGSGVANPGLGNAGLYIGWLERFLLLTAVLLESPAALGLILAAKSVFRFDDIRQGRASTEYFLIGTLVSVSQAVAGGLAIRWLLQQLGP
jgi:hypothetical protein